MYSSSEIFARLRAFAGAIAVHVLMAALVVLGTMNWQPFRKSQPVGLTIEAVIMDTGEVKKQRDAARQAVEREQNGGQQGMKSLKQRGKCKASPAGLFIAAKQEQYQ